MVSNPLRKPLEVAEAVRAVATPDTILSASTDDNVEPIALPPSATSGCARSFWFMMESLVESEGDCQDTMVAKMVVLLVASFVGFLGVFGGIFFMSFSAHIVSAITMLMIPMACIVVVIMTHTRRVEVPREILCMGITLFGLANFVALGGNFFSSAIVSWAFLGPQIGLMTGIVTWRPRLLAACLAMIIVTYAVFELFVDPATLSLAQGHAEKMPQEPTSVLLAVNSMLPGVIAFAIASFVIQDVKAQRDSLQQELDIAYSIAQKMANFELDDLPHSDSVAVVMLRHVARNMKRYRPYLPDHLFATQRSFGPGPLSGSSSSMGAGSDVEAIRIPALSTSNTTDLWINSESMPGSRRAGSSHSSDHNESKHKLPASQSEERARMKCMMGGHSPHLTKLLKVHRPLKHVAGSLLLIVLPEVQRLVESAGADCMTRIGEVVELFSKTAISLIKENQGVMQLIIGDQCLATWNVLQRSSMHVTNAITTAISIRDSWARVSMQVLSSTPPLSMGVWSGPMYCGSFGTADIRGAGAVGCELKRVALLQRYAARTSRTIMANAEVWRHILDAPSHRLVPVDVLDLSDSSGPPKPNVPRTKGEIVYECVQAISAGTPDEWMYQLQELKQNFSAEFKLNELWAQLQDGVPDWPSAEDSFYMTLKGLQATRDFHVMMVCSEIHAIIAGCATNLGPYCRRLTNDWQQDKEASPPKASESVSRVGTQQSLWSAASQSASPRPADKGPSSPNRRIVRPGTSSLVPQEDNDMPLQLKLRRNLSEESFCSLVSCSL